MTAAMGIPDNAAVKMRSAMNNSKGWNMLASHKKVLSVRQTHLPFGKGSWSFQKHMLYGNKQGKNKRKQNKTHVAIVKISSLIYKFMPVKKVINFVKVIFCLWL